MAQQQGWAVLWGRAHAPEQHLLYRIWVDVLHGVLGYGYWPWQEVAASPMRYQPLTFLLPEVAELFLTTPVVHSENPEQFQFRLWDAILILVATISTHTPVLIVLDDLHWADQASCALLGYLVRHLTGKRVLFLGISREQDIAPGHALRALCAHLHQQLLLTDLTLSPLTDSQIGHLIAPVPASLAQDIQRRAAGNPFIAEELACFPRAQAEPPASPSSLFARGDALPARISDLFEQRAALLGPAAQKMLAAAAVLGTSFSLQMLSLMQKSGDPSGEEILLDQLDEALQARLLLEENRGAQILYHFWHPLLLEYFYTRLSAARRAHLHRRAARVLQTLAYSREEDVAASIVYHLVRGGSEPSMIVHYALLCTQTVSLSRGRAALPTRSGAPW